MFDFALTFDKQVVNAVVKSSFFLIRLLAKSSRELYVLLSHLD